MRQTSRAGIPPDCAVRLAEKLALVAFRLFFPGPYDFMPLSVVEP